jgi:hypothetical protein
MNIIDTRYRDEGNIRLPSSIYYHTYKNLDIWQIFGRSILNTSILFLTGGKTLIINKMIEDNNILMYEVA